MHLLDAIALHLPPGFVIKDAIGSGATSTAYLARKDDTGEQLVVKVMKPGTVTPENKDRFVREMQVLQSLEHPRVIPILAPGEAAGALFFTMPFREGPTLRHRLRHGDPFTLMEAVTVAREVAEALGHAHSKGIVHRDVKPENILLAADGACLMDFGLANLTSTSWRTAGRERSLTPVGTPAYMSPEQVKGDRAQDRRSDFYSLGCVLFEMLAGSPPFGLDSSRSTVSRRLRESPPDVRTRRPDVPDELASLIRRLLDPHASGRPASAVLLVGALERIAERIAEEGDSHP
jgi:serine/threonine-protein kinase